MRPAAKAVSKSRENEKRRKSAARKRKWRERQSAEQQSEIWQTDRTGHADGHAGLSAERQSEIWQTNWTGHAEGRIHLSEEQHTENDAHHLNFLLLKHFSSNFVFVITYHTARQIIERPCHLLSHAVHNSKLTTLPQSKRR